MRSVPKGMRRSRLLRRVMGRGWRVWGRVVGGLRFRSERMGGTEGSRDGVEDREVDEWMDGWRSMPR